MHKNYAIIALLGSTLMVVRNKEQHFMFSQKQETILQGIYPPLPTFFDAQEELDFVTYQRHIRFLADTNIAGYVVMGTNGEAVHLSSEERVRLIAATREAGGHNAQVIAGCGEQSTRATIANCRLAASAGANFALVLPPSCYKSRM